MVNRPDEPISNLEAALRGSAPALPASLKSRTLAKCATRVAAKRERERRVNRYLTLGIAGILMTQWLTVSVIDGQTNQLVGGVTSQPAFSSISVAQAIELLQSRSREITLWIAPPISSIKSS